MQRPELISGITPPEDGSYAILSLGGGIWPEKGWDNMRWFLVLLALLALVGLGIDAQQGFTIRGRVGATDQEAQEGYFALDGQTMIVVKPGSELHGYLRGIVGRRVRITIEPERESE